MSYFVAVREPKLSQSVLMYKFSEYFYRDQFISLVKEQFPNSEVIYTIDTTEIENNITIVDIINVIASLNIKELELLVRIWTSCAFNRVENGHGGYLLSQEEQSLVDKGLIDNSFGAWVFEKNIYWRWQAPSCLKGRQIIDALNSAMLYRSKVLEQRIEDLQNPYKVKDQDYLECLVAARMV